MVYKMSAEEKAAKIIEKCGFVKNFLLEMDLNDEIRELEEFARSHRPPTTKTTESLTKFLPPEQAKKLEQLRKERLELRKKQDRSMACAKNRISAEGIVLIKTKKGIFAEQMEPKKEEEKEGLAALFG